MNLSPTPCHLANNLSATRESAATLINGAQGRKRAGSGEVKAIAAPAGHQGRLTRRASELHDASRSAWTSTAGMQYRAGVVSTNRG